MSNIEVIDDCQVEWDRTRGVLYVHDKSTGRTIVRICGLRRDVSPRVMLSNSILDITRPEIVQYPIED